jgi:hypothetical protein
MTKYTDIEGGILLGQLIDLLDTLPPDLRMPIGFGVAHSYRGYYSDVSFAPAEDVTIGEMLEEARAAVGSTYCGWKGGEYTMDRATKCWLAHDGDCGDRISESLVRAWVRLAGVDKP